MEGSASKDIASIEPKLRSGSWIDKLVIIVINLDIFLRIKVKEVVHPKGNRGLWSKVIRYGKISDYFSTDHLVSPLIEYKISYLVSSSDDIWSSGLAIISIAQVAIPFSYGKIVRKSSFEARDYLFQKYARAFGEELIALGVCISPTFLVWVRLKAKSLVRENLSFCSEWLSTTSIPLVSTSTALAKNCTVLTLAKSNICLSSFSAVVFPAGREKASVRIIRSSTRIK